MEQLLNFGGIKVLLTTGADRSECQQWEWWDQADVVISVTDTVKVPKGETLLGAPVTVAGRPVIRGWEPSGEA